MIGFHFSPRVKPAQQQLQTRSLSSGQVSAPLALTNTSTHTEGMPLPGRNDANDTCPGLVRWCWHFALWSTYPHLSEESTLLSCNENFNAAFLSFSFCTNSNPYVRLATQAGLAVKSW